VTARPGLCAPRLPATVGQVVCNGSTIPPDARTVNGLVPVVSAVDRDFPGV